MAGFAVDQRLGDRRDGVEGSTMLLPPIIPSFSIRLTLQVPAYAIGGRGSRCLSRLLEPLVQPVETRLAVTAPLLFARAVSTAAMSAWLIFETCNSFRFFAWLIWRASRGIQLLGCLARVAKSDSRCDTQRHAALLRAELVLPGSPAISGAMRLRDALKVRQAAQRHYIRSEGRTARAQSRDGGRIL